jgi:hypothetical protein
MFGDGHDGQQSEDQMDWDVFGPQSLEQTKVLMAIDAYFGGNRNTL